MAEKNLEQKINDLAFWTCIFLILYLITGYLFQTAWLKEQLELKKIFDLIKDGLSITAAFLAPAAALVLFSDWRSEHNVKSIFQLLDDIKSQTNDIEDSLKLYIYKVFHPDRDIIDKYKTSPENLKLLNLISNLKRLQQEISGKKQISADYLILLNKFEETASRAKGHLEMMDYSRHLVKKYENTLKELELIPHEQEIKFHRHFFKESLEAFNKCFERIQNINRHLLVECQKIKNEL